MGAAIFRTPIARMIFAASLAILCLAGAGPAFQEPAVALRSPVPRDPRWLAFPGGTGPGAGKRVVLLAGDEEYRSEEALPMLAQLLAERHGFETVVLFSQDPESGAIDPGNQTHVPGLHLLDDADLVLLALRFRELPDADMAHFDAYLASGRPLIGLRTSTHAFDYRRDPDSKYAHWTWNADAPRGGFGGAVLGDTWVAHHGGHGSESTGGRVEAAAADLPILRGVHDVWGPTDVYTVRALPADATLLLRGLVLAGMDPADPPVTDGRNEPAMALAWIRERPLPGGEVQRVFCTTMGAAQDFANEGLRRLVVQACYWGLGLEAAIPASGADVALRSPYVPSAFGFGRHRPGLRPADYRAGMPDR